MTEDMHSLEMSYRRLLLAYPRTYRQANGSEMLGVLMANAPDGRRRPTLADAANLIGFGLLARLRTGHLAGTHERLRDGLALFSLAAPVVLLIPVVVVMLQDGYTGWWQLARGAVIAVPALLGWRRITFAMLVLSACYSAVLAGAPLGMASWHFTWLYLSAPAQGLYLAFWLLEGIALIWSPGPRRGRQLLTWPGALSLILIGVLLGLFWTGTGSERADLAELAVGIAALVVLAVSSRPGRYVAALLTIMLYPYVLSFATVPWRLSPGHLLLVSPGWLALMYLPEVAVAGLIIAAAMPSRHRGTPAQPDPPVGAGD